MEVRISNRLAVLLLWLLVLLAAGLPQVPCDLAAPLVFRAVHMDEEEHLDVDALVRSARVAKRISTPMAINSRMPAVGARMPPVHHFCVAFHHVARDCDQPSGSGGEGAFC